MTYRATCMKEKKEITVKDPKLVIMANCNVAVRGVCPNDGCKVIRILSADKIPADMKKKQEECKRNKPASAKKAKKGGASRKSRKSKSSKSKSRKSKSRK